MDTTPGTPSLRPPAGVALGQLVFYFEKGSSPRAALVGSVHEDGRTCDLVVLMDGNPAVPETRQAWALGSGVVRARISIPFVDDDPARARHWSHPVPCGVVSPGDRAIATSVEGPAALVLVEPPRG